MKIGVATSHSIYREKAFNKEFNFNGAQRSFETKAVKCPFQPWPRESTRVTRVTSYTLKGLLIRVWKICCWIACKRIDHLDKIFTLRYANVNLFSCNCKISLFLSYGHCKGHSGYSTNDSDSFLQIMFHWKQFQ